MEIIIKTLIIILISYLIGSFPTAIIISKRFFGFDIREKGSGNMGSTNAFRVLGIKWGIIIQAVDILKGLIPVILFSNFLGNDIIFPNTNAIDSIIIIKLVAGLSAICGHIWSIFAGFKGGKGINTALGMLLAIAPLDVLFAIIAFIIVLFTTGYVSLGSIIATSIIPLSIFIRSELLKAEINGYNILIFFFLITALLLIFTHRKNIVRLLNGTENSFEKLKIFKKKKV